ncbi:DNA-directed DNA polymerase [Moraxella macacae 0408225]|uniref:DNA-directed DNA polymerase n=1 Tax=Moraxella macacae 0408225 TaxID=1230338 RepID=L2F8N8_9GAMM|nr:DNA-directed DNA polymerase [Moraxella macacae]ELA08838.1 DNA-directed DNA polymerase [Moraxella macacae 0408225]
MTNAPNSSNPSPNLPSNLSSNNKPKDSTVYHPIDPVDQTVIKNWLFDDLLPWQRTTWQYFTEHFNDGVKLPHALLIAGNAGTGKRAFVYRFVAWAFCQQKSNIDTACGKCESCQWLLANTHPNLYQIPPLAVSEIDKKPKKTNQLQDQSPTHQHSALIKIDDIRQMQPFVQQSSDGIRMVVIHQADSMTLGASNALLKTLEEPAPNVLLFLISDTPSQLLPTVRSRLQFFNVSDINPKQSLDFMQQRLANVDPSDFDLFDLKQVNQMSGFAPFVAMDMLYSEWYQQRQIWLNSWQAVRSASRGVIQASDYWQKTLSLSDFLYLSQLMLLEIGNYCNDLPVAQTDIQFDKLQPKPDLRAILHLQNVINQIWLDRRQHIQDKLCYDKLINALQMC